MSIEIIDSEKILKRCSEKSSFACVLSKDFSKLFLFEDYFKCDNFFEEPIPPREENINTYVINNELENYKVMIEKFNERNFLNSYRFTYKEKKIILHYSSSYICKDSIKELEILKTNILKIFNESFFKCDTIIITAFETDYECMNYKGPKKGSAEYCNFLKLDTERIKKIENTIKKIIECEQIIKKADIQYLYRYIFNRMYLHYWNELNTELHICAGEIGLFLNGKLSLPQMIANEIFEIFNLEAILNTKEAAYFKYFVDKYKQYGLPINPNYFFYKNVYEPAYISLNAKSQIKSYANTNIFVRILLESVARNFDLPYEHSDSNNPDIVDNDVNFERYSQNLIFEFIEIYINNFIFLYKDKKYAKHIQFFLEQKQKLKDNIFNQIADLDYKNQGETQIAQYIEKEDNSFIPKVEWGETYDGTNQNDYFRKKFNCFFTQTKEYFYLKKSDYDNIKTIINKNIQDLLDKAVAEKKIPSLLPININSKHSPITQVVKKNKRKGIITPLTLAVKKSGTEMEIYYKYPSCIRNITTDSKNIVSHKYTLQLLKIALKTPNTAFNIAKADFTPCSGDENEALSWFLDKAFQPLRQLAQNTDDKYIFYYNRYYDKNTKKMNLKVTQKK
ncbi:hypothetical protein KA977_01965 [Candidatus Dependentiae bacterium]|nr:hypothetical protein [Candidatus Dependentiae bacterium]